MAHVGAETGGRRFFDQFLPPPLDGAFAFSQAQDPPVTVPDDLDFDVAGLRHQRFEIDSAVAKGSLGFVPGCLHHLFQFVAPACQADAASTAASHGLDQDRVFDLLEQAFRDFVSNRFVRSGQDG